MYAQSVFMDVFAIIPLPHHLKASTHLLPPYPTPRALSNLQANQRSLLYNPLHNKKKSAPRYYANHHPLHKYAHTHTHWTGFLLCEWMFKITNFRATPLRSCAKFKRLPVMTLSFLLWCLPLPPPHKITTTISVIAKWREFPLNFLVGFLHQSVTFSCFGLLE